MKKYISPILIVIFFNLPSTLTARDVNLDEIYIKKTSAHLKKLVIEKLDAYQKIDAVFVDRNIIFADWFSGDELIYIKEIDSLKTNIIFKNKLRERKPVELCRLNGVITTARATPNGRYYIIKRLIIDENSFPRGELIIIDVKSGKMSIKNTSYAFLDFSMARDGNSIVLEKRSGIVELFLDTEGETELLNKKKYNDIIISGNPSFAYLSPDRQKILVLNGSGGNYRAKIFWDNNSSGITGISSSSEICWLDNHSILYRSGYAGNYSVMLYNIKTFEKIPLLNKSFNTNITYTANSGTAAFLKEQIIFLYNIADNEIINTGIEGEDVSFAPNGSRFISLMFKKLFVVNNNLLGKRQIDLKRTWKSIFLIYDDLKNKSDDFLNEYSRLFIGRKTQVYKELAN